MPWPLYLALKQLFPSGRFFSFYSGLSIIGVTLGVMVLLIVQTVMNGFGEKIRENIVNRDADIRIIGNSILYDWKPLLAELEAHGAVAAATPYAEGLFMMKNDAIPSWPFIRGIDLERESNVFPVEQYLANVQPESLRCTLDDLDDETIILGADLAHSLQAGPGSRLEVFTPLMLEKFKRDEMMLPREMEVAGFFQSGWYEVDSNTAIVTLRVMQDLYGLGRGIHGFALKLRDGSDAERVAREMEAELTAAGHDVRALSWLKKNESFLFFLNMEKWVMFFIMIFIILVASFSIAVTLSVSVLRKTREIGLLSAIGARPGQVATTFCLQSISIGAIGVVLGTAGALLALRYRNVVVESLLKIFDAQDSFYRLYGFEGIPAAYSLRDFVLVAVFSMILTAFAGLLPAIRAARLKPAEALRSE